MKRMIAVGLVGLMGVMSSGCGWLESNYKSVSSDALAVVQCVIAGAEAGQTVEQIATVTCGPMLEADVLTILAATNTSVVSSAGLKAVMATHPGVTVKVRAVPAKK